MPEPHILAAIIWALILAGAGGALTSIGPWYRNLKKPSWQPPDWLFGPAWTTLYTLMAIAAWLVWKRVGFTRALGFYFVQLILNAAWTPIFFGAHAMGWALVEISIMWIAILLTLLSFLRVQKTAGLLLVPYLAWVSFATFLNFTLWRLNPS
jgi:tryptophan-rich sensory protein